MRDIQNIWTEKIKQSIIQKHKIFILCTCLFVVNIKEADVGSKCSCSLEEKIAKKNIWLHHVRDSARVRVKLWCWDGMDLYFIKYFW